MEKEKEKEKGKGKEKEKAKKESEIIDNLQNRFAELSLLNVTVSGSQQEVRFFKLVAC